MSGDSQSSERSRLRGVLERIVYYNEESHYCIGELRPEKGRELVSVLGTLPNVQCGETLEMEGYSVNHREYGRQFKITQFRSMLPSSVYGIRKYLGSGLVPGIGKTYAEKIVDRFGADTLRIIDEDSGRIREVEGIGPKRAAEIKKAWDAQRAQREVMVFLQTYGVSASLSKRLIDRYGAGAQTMLRNHPYEVARTVDGIGFKTADRIALNLGFANDSPERIDAGLVHTLKTLEDDGHTAFEREAVLADAATLLNCDVARVAERIPPLIDANVLVEAEPGIYQLPSSARAELTIAEHLYRLLHSRSRLPPIKIEAAVAWAQQQAGFNFASEQGEAVRRGLEKQVSILTGGPGTGKTTILRAIVSILRAKKARVVLTAPTGRAAQRMSESCRHSASTLHRLLKFDPTAGGFTHDAANPLKGDFFIIDEASMLDTRMAAAFLRSIPTGAHLIFVGDAHQLPSVAAGNVLHDLIASDEFAVTSLQRIFRQDEDSSIVTVAHRILAGSQDPPPMARTLDQIDPQRDIQILVTPSPEACVDAVQQLCAEVLPRLLGHSSEIQVLAPMHRGTVGIRNLNKVLQEALNPKGASTGSGEAGAQGFRVGDRVLQNRNNYDKGVFNGDLGRIVAVDRETGDVVVAFDTERITYSRGELGELIAAYAITVHKAQGSEFPIVVLPLVRAHFMLLQRNLLYTAITRARERVILVGELAAYGMAVRNQSGTERHTGLQSKLIHALD